MDEHDLDIPPFGQPRPHGAQRPEPRGETPRHEARVEPLTANEPEMARAADPLGPEPLAPAAEANAEADLKEAAAKDTAKDAEIADLKDKVLRTMAEMENLRRRTEREREDAVKYAAGKFAKDILSVADNLRRALDAVAASADPAVRNLASGVEATERELLSVFERHGIKRIEALGARFDPNLHQAMFEIPDPSQPAGTVVQVAMPGYLIGDRLLRPAMVGVASGGPAAGVDTKA